MQEKKSFWIPGNIKKCYMDVSPALAKTNFNQRLKAKEDFKKFE